MGDDKGPGWWQASDGEWYPPDQHPDPAYRDRFPPAPPAPGAPSGAVPPIPPVPTAPTPTVPPVPAAPVPAAPVTAAPTAGVIDPKPAKSGPGRAVGIVVAVVLVLGAGVGAFLLSGGGDDDETATTAIERTTTTTDGGQTDDTGADETTTTSVDEETTTTVAEGLDPQDPPFDSVVVDVDDPASSFQVPADFLVVQAGQTGAQVAPDDADLAAAIDRIVAGLPGSVAIAIDPAFDPLAEQPPTVIAVTVQVPEEGTSVSEQAQANLDDYQEAGIIEAGDVTDVDDTTAVLRFTSPGGSVSYQVFRSLGDSVVVFAAIGVDEAVFSPIADAVAASLDDA